MIATSHYGRLASGFFTLWVLYFLFSLFSRDIRMSISQHMAIALSFFIFFLFAILKSEMEAQHPPKKIHLFEIIMILFFVFMVAFFLHFLLAPFFISYAWVAALVFISGFCWVIFDLWSSLQK